ncbi:MAG: hypothetical protein ABIP30_01480 [Ferruginibacter sp.]
MKALLGIILICSIYSCKKNNDPVTNPPNNTDSFSVTVNNGYGSGKYKVGDTVHIWSKEITPSQIFDAWTGDISLLNNNDWHAWFVMPSGNTTLTANIKNTAAFTLKNEMIRGRDRMKPVYYFLPAASKGTVFLLHGTGGSALQFVSGFEEGEVIKELINNGFGIIVTEAEEATTGIDTNGDGKLRWTQLPVDTIANIDYANIRIITDTFYNRGFIDKNKPRYSLGMSNGGAFSAALSYVYKYKAGISYCAPAGSFISSASNVPFQFCMQRFDNNPQVGPQGNADALTNSQTLSSRSICSTYFINEHSPLYPQRFARNTSISIATSAAIFNEIKNNGFLNSKNYFIGYSDDLKNTLLSHPSSFPTIISLNILQQSFILAEIDCCVTDHHMFSDFTKLSLKFLNTQCQ